MTTKHTILAWLQAHPVATIATLSDQCVPQMAVVYAYVDEQFQCYFITKEATRKYDNLMNDQVVSVSWFDEKTLTTCKMSGEAHIVQAKKEAAAAITHLQELVMGQRSTYWTPPVGQIAGTQYVVFRVTTEQIDYVDYSLVTQSNPKPKKLSFQPEHTDILSSTKGDI